mgnify:CR=1 FL=1
MTTLFSPIREFFKKGDVLLLFLCLTASGYGLALIYSATRYLDNNNRNVIVQAVAICIGVVIYIVLTFVDFQLFVEKCWKWLVAFDVGFILLLLTPLGKESGGNRNWLQPNEIVKIPFILLLAWQAARIHQQERDISSSFSVAQLTGHTLLMVGLIAVVCGDIGMCVIYLFLFVTISWMAGVKARWFALGGTCFVGAILGAWFTILQSDRFAYIRNRFMVVLDHSLDPLGAGFQQSRSLLAIGSGGLFGMGMGQGRQKFAYLPYPESDFIFAIVGEDFGLIGCLTVIALFVLFVLAGLRVSLACRDRFGCLLGAGITSMIGLQAFINMGVVTGMLPTTGLPLPFFSAGGTSVSVMMAAVGVLLSISRENGARIVEPTDQQSGGRA